jgi:hypothetical protein
MLQLLDDFVGDAGVVDDRYNEPNTASSSSWLLWRTATRSVQLTRRIKPILCLFVGNTSLMRLHN